MATKKRGFETVRDMVLSLGVVGIVVVALLIFGRHSERNPVRPIDYSLKFQQASQVAPYPLLAPEGLPDRWRPTSADYDSRNPSRVTWHIGFINPNEQYAAVEQVNGPAAPFVADKGKGGKPVGVQNVAGVQWKSYDGPKYRSLVHEQGGVTTMVTGTATFEDLAQLAAALRPSTAPGAQAPAAS